MSLARIRIAARLLAVAALAALTAGCFQPMYAEHADGTPGIRDKLLAVEVPPVDKPNASHEARVQVAIRNALAFKLYGNATGAPPLYRLELKFTTSRSTLMTDPLTALPTDEIFRHRCEFHPGRNRHQQDGDDRQHLLAGLLRYSRQLSAFCPLPRRPRRRGPRRRGNRRTSPRPAGVVLLRRHLVINIPQIWRHPEVRAVARLEGWPHRTYLHPSRLAQVRDAKASRSSHLGMTPIRVDS